MTLKDELRSQLDQLIVQGQRLVESYRPGEMGSTSSDVPEVDFRAFYTAGLAALERVAGTGSVFYRSVPAATTVKSLSFPGYEVESPVSALTGALVALRDAVDGGLLVRLETRLRANVHDDFLQQARDLLDAGYHVAAMVLVGGVLENHLLKMVTSRGLSWSGSGSLSKYNDLLRDNPYPLPVWRRIQAIGDVRNHAAHGDTGAVNVDDVADAHRYVGRFLTDYPE